MIFMIILEFEVGWKQKAPPVLADVDTAKCSKHGGIIIKLNKKENMENWKNNTGKLLCHALIYNQSVRWRL